MSNFAIIVAGERGTPRAVRLAADGDALQLMTADGSSEGIAWWRLYRIADEGTTHRFRRLDRAEWELRVSSGGDQALLSHVRKGSLFRFIRPLRRLEGLKVAAGIAVLVLTLGQHAPAEWGAKLVPEFAQRRLVDGIDAQLAPNRCSHEGGESAVRKLLMRLDPNLGPSVQIVAMNEPGFMITSVPGKTIFIQRGAIAETQTDEFAALLAHEMAHIRHGDAVTAAVRHNGVLGVWAAALEGNGRQNLLMDFSGLEERRADLDAMQMLRRAGIPMRPAAEMFERMRIAKAQHSGFAAGQREFHFGIDARAQRWASMARTDPPDLPPVLTRDEDDALFNFCWAGRIMPLPNQSQSEPTNSIPPGSGGIATPAK